jgi:hypothetical protein
MSSESRTMVLTNNGMVNHYLRDVDHGSHCLPRHRTDVSHTCPNRHLKVQSYEDTGEFACAAQKGNEFARQPSFPRLLQDTVSAHSVRPLRRQRSSCCSKHHTVLWRSPSRHFVCRSLLHVALFDVSKGLDAISLKKLVRNPNIFQFARKRWGLEKE